MKGDDRLLPRLYRELAQQEKRVSRIADEAEDLDDIEELGMLFSEMTQSKLNLANKMAVTSAVQTFNHETEKFVLANIS